MKKIKIGFDAFCESFDPENNLITNLLRRHFDVQLSGEPDFLFTADFWYGPHRFDLNKYKGVRIGYTGENAGADFNTFDYFIGFHRLEYPDRYCRVPNIIFDCDFSDYSALENAMEFIAQKDIFCNFCFSHRSESGAREKILDLLSSYKQVNCYGPFINNTSPFPMRISRQEKQTIVARSKFTICCESTSRDGFITEKIWDAFKHHSIPIYYGDPGAVELFNPKAFVNMHAFSNWEEAAAYVIQLDQDPQAYQEMLCQSPFTDPQLPGKMLERLEQFLVHICDQPPERAIRRPNCFMPEAMDDYLALLKPYAKKLEKREQLRFRWRQRWYWGLMLLHRLLPAQFSEPDKEMLSYEYKQHERAVKKR